MTLDNWNPEDYRLDFPDITFEGKLVDAPIIFKVGKVHEYVEFVLKDAVNAVVKGSELSGLVLGLSIVDYLAGYYSGKETSSNDYKNYLRKYFPNKYFPYIEAVYNQLRCGLLHNLVAYQPYQSKNRNQYDFVIHKEQSNHLERKDGKTVFSIRTFFEDLSRSFIMYSYDLIMKPDENQELIKNFTKRFNKKDAKASVMVITPD